MASPCAPPDPWLKQLLGAEWTDGTQARPARPIIDGDHVVIGGMVAPVGSARPAGEPDAILSFDLLHDG